MDEEKIERLENDSIDRLSAENTVYERALLALVLTHPDREALRPILTDLLEKADQAAAYRVRSDTHVAHLQDAVNQLLVALDVDLGADRTPGS